MHDHDGTSQHPYRTTGTQRPTSTRCTAPHPVLATAYSHEAHSDTPCTPHNDSGDDTHDTDDDAHGGDDDAYGDDDAHDTDGDAHGSDSHSLEDDADAEDKDDANADAENEDDAGGRTGASPADTRTDLKGEARGNGARSTRTSPLDVPAHSTAPSAETSAQMTLHCGGHAHGGSVWNK